MRRGSNAGIQKEVPFSLLLAGLLFALTLSACGSSLPTATDSVLPVESLIPTETTVDGTPMATPTATDMPPPPRLLTICLGREPASLFWYDANSTAALGVLAAVYDGPFDLANFEPQAVILSKLPSLVDGDVLVEPVEVQPGDLFVDADGYLRELTQGERYRQSGCTGPDCVRIYEGDQPITLDQVRVRFELLPGITWSDGEPLTSADSVYSFEVARELYPTALPDLVGRTASYQVLDELTLEWVGLPGYMDGLYHDKFFAPLPEHVWGAMPAEELRTAEVSSRTPLGWGPYVIDEWTAGDHISLHRSPNYFRSASGLPNFDNLVYRFVADSDEALEALLAGECDLVDQSAMLDAQVERLLELQAADSLKAVFETATAWELIALGINSLDEGHVGYFASKEVRQALAACINRREIAEALYGSQALAADSYVPPEHPLYYQGEGKIEFDPASAAARLEGLGWLDQDADPSTPRVAQGVIGVLDGTPFQVNYLVSPDPERSQAAQMLKEDLEGCGIQLNIVAQPFQEYLAAGPEGPVFGRDFDMAHFAWSTSVEPPCYLYLGSEIPGPYPEYPKGWGGVNASGYSNPAYDQACLQALFSLPDSPGHAEAHHQAQAIFAQDLPSIPLYWRFRVVVTRPDMCTLNLDPSTPIALADIEAFDYGQGCQE